MLVSQGEGWTVGLCGLWLLLLAALRSLVGRHSVYVCVVMLQTLRPPSACGIGMRMYTKRGTKQNISQEHCLGHQVVTK